MENKFTKKQYLTSFTGFAPVWDAEIGCYNINSSNLLFFTYNGTVQIRSNKETKQKIVIFNDEYVGTIILQPKDFIVVEGGIAVKDSDYMRNKLQAIGYCKYENLKFISTGYQFMWDMEKEEKAKAMLENGNAKVLVGGNK